MMSPNEPTKEGPLSFVLFEFPFTSVSTDNRGHPSPVSLASILANGMVWLVPNAVPISSREGVLYALPQILKIPHFLLVK
jgi:hypothetical protein